MIKYIYESGMSTFMYYGFHVLGFVAIIFFNIWYGKKYHISKKHTLLITATLYLLMYLWIHIQFWIESGFQRFGGQNMVRGLIYIPLIAIPVAKLFKIRWSRVCDMIAVCPCIVQGISHIGCVFPGCCEGYQCSFGLYNPLHGVRMFPSQLFESFTALIIAAYLVLRAKKLSYKSDGLSMPIMLMLFGSTRFLWEFARNNEKILLGCSSLAFHALFMAVVGLNMYIVINENNKRRESIKTIHSHNRRVK